MQIPAHKMVLASCSPYFYAMFSGSDFEESRQDKITVQGVDFHALELLIDYVYTSYVDVTEENVQVLHIYIAYTRLNLADSIALFRSKLNQISNALDSFDCCQFTSIDGCS